MSPFNRYIENSRREQKLRRELSGYLANKLVGALGIKEGSELVPFIGLGTEKSNQEAVETWVYYVCSDMKLSFGDKHFNTLLCILEPVVDRLSADLKLPITISKQADINS